MTEGSSGNARNGLRSGTAGAAAPHHGRRSGKTPGWRWPRIFPLPLAVWLLVLLLPTPVQAVEDSARLVFQKTAVSGRTRVHVVKQGEWIADILRNQFGETVVPYALIRRLNPGIRNLDRILPGQKIILPAPGSPEIPETPAGAGPADSPPQPVIYRIMEGDSISRIILSEMNLSPAEALPAYRIIRKLNPAIPDMNQLPVGETLRLPTTAARPAGPPPAPLPDAATPAPLPDTPLSAETSGTAKAAMADPLLSAGKSGTERAAYSDTLLGIIRPVILRMRGAVTASGSYFIPLQETTQISIDCAQIPVVEMDDGTTVLLDYGNHLSPNLKALIRQIWKNYGFLTAEQLRGELGGLPAIVGHSRNYRMVRVDKPLEMTEKPEILLYPDWVIHSQDAARGAAYRQGLFLLERGEQPLPAEVRAFIEKSGVAVTEIAEGRAVSAPAAPPEARPAVVDLRGMKGIAFAESLLKTLGETPVRNAEIAVFDQARNGYNLSITADLLVRRDEKRLILLAKRLPEEFNQILREAGTGVVTIGEREPERTLVEGMLKGLGIPVSYGHFTFRIPNDGKRPRLAGSFSTLRVMNEGEPVYLIDFDLPPAVQPFLNGGRGGRVVRY